MSAPRRHTLKCWPGFFGALKSRLKRFEVRLDDRGFETGDHLVLREWDPQTMVYSGEQLEFPVLFIYRGAGLEEGYCVMSLGEVVG